MDDLNEQLDISNDISTAITSISPSLDESELSAELEKLEQEEFDKHMVDIPAATISLPDVPGDTLVKEKKKGILQNSLKIHPDF